MQWIQDISSEIVSFLYHVSPALVMVVLGSFILQRFFISRSNEAAYIDFLFKELDELRADTLEYWNIDCTKGDKDQKTDKTDRTRILEQKIKGMIKSLTGELQYYCNRYCKKRKEDFTGLMVEVSDACTGGQFESEKKTRDCGRYLIVVNSINRVKSELIRRKL